MMLPRDGPWVILLTDRGHFGGRIRMLDRFGYPTCEPHRAMGFPSRRKAARWLREWAAPTPGFAFTVADLRDGAPVVLPASRLYEVRDRRGPGQVVPLAVLTAADAAEARELARERFSGRSVTRLEVRPVKPEAAERMARAKARGDRTVRRALESDDDAARARVESAPPTPDPEPPPEAPP